MQNDCAIFGWMLVAAGLLLLFTNGRSAVPLGLIVAAALVYALVCFVDEPKSVTHSLK